MAAAARRQMTSDCLPLDPLDAPPRYARYRIEVFGEARSPWRNSSDEAMVDAIELQLANWDGSRREHFLAVPVDMKVEIVTGRSPCDR
jgi:hypothetical protein